ncbi:MAG: recombinase family protein [Eubacteriales bacterium]
MAFAKIKPVPQECALNAVIYARYSSDKQTENSIDGQLRMCTEFCQAHGYHVVGEYIDRAVSGTTDNRPEFQRMIDDAQKQQFAFIVVYRFDRFARNRFDSAIYKKKLEFVGVRVISASEQVGSGDEGIILESIYEAMDEAYSRRLSRITKRGMREAAIKGYWTGGNVPLGYTVIDHRLSVNDREAAAVKKIYALYADGKTKTQIAEDLNEAGYRTKNGKSFTSSNLSGILKNRMYIGDYRFDDIERICPEIIDQALFEKVQEKLDKNKVSRGKKISDTFFELSGKLFCGECGSAMVGDSGTSRSGERHYYYTCGNRKKRKGCNKKSEKKDYIEWYICEQTLDTVLTAERIKTIAAKVVQINQEDTDPAAIEQLEKQIAGIDRELDKCADALINASSNAVIERINTKAQDLEKQKQDCEIELSKLRLASDMVLTEKQVIDYLESFKHGDLLDESFRHQMINALINCVYLFDDKVIIYYNIKGVKQISYMDVISSIDQLVDGSDCVLQGEPKKS